MFYSLGAEQENDPSYIVVRDFGTYNVPLSVDRKLRYVLVIPVSVQLICILGLGHSMLYM